MRNASIHRFAGHWPKEKAVGTLTLDFDAKVVWAGGEKARHFRRCLTIRWSSPCANSATPHGRNNP